MRKIIYITLCTLLFGCKKTAVKTDQLRFVFKSEYGSYGVTKDGVLISPDNIDKEIRQVTEFKAPLISGVYRATLTSVPPGFSYIYIFVNDKKVAEVERSHSNRVNIEVSYTVQ